MSRIFISNIGVLTVMQEVNNYIHSSISTNSGSFALMGLSVVVNPKFTNSGILVIVHGTMALTGTAGSNANGYLTLFKNGSNVFVNANGAFVLGGNAGDPWPGNFWSPYSMVYYDQPCGSGPITYALAGRTDNTNVNVYSIAGQCMTAIEIAQ